MLAQDIELLLEYAGKLRVEEHISSGLYFENKELAYIEIFATEITGGAFNVFCNNK